MGPKSEAADVYTESLQQNKQHIKQTSVTIPKVLHTFHSLL